MPYGASYASNPAPGVADVNKRKPARTVSYDQTNIQPAGTARGKFANGKGSMNTGGKRRPGRFGK